MPDLHNSLRTERLTQSNTGGVELVLVKLQSGRDDIRYSLHAKPHSWSTSGLQTSDFLHMLGFQRSECLILGGECFVREANQSWDIPLLDKEFSKAYKSLLEAEKHLRECGIFLDVTEGFGYFNGRPSQSRSYSNDWTGDGHTSSKTQRMKAAEDDVFKYSFTWLETNSTRGWTTHYRAKHPPISEEMMSVFQFLRLKEFNNCPEFDFDECHYRFIRYEQRGDSIFDGNADAAHRWFDNHAQHFMVGVRHLLDAQATMAPFGLSFIPKVRR